MTYIYNQEIADFISTAQLAIGRFGAVLATEEDQDELEFITTSLINFVDCLVSPYINWTEEEVLRYIHYWNNRANLNNLPFIQMTNYYVGINQGSSNGDPSNIEDLIQEVLARTPHNSLINIQGGTTNERYHLTKEEKDWLDCQRAQTPCPQSIDFSVLLELTSNGVKWPSGYYELGTGVSSNTLQGTINYGNNKQVLSYSYKRNGVVLGSTIINPQEGIQPNPYIDDFQIKTDTTFSFEAKIGNDTKKDEKTVSFRQPMYYGIINVDNYTNTTILLQGTKDVRDKGEMDLTFTLPDGNSSLDSGYKVPFLFIPNSWGMISSAISSTFDFVDDFHDFGRDMPLADGSIASGRIIIDTTQLEGVVSFKFKW